MARYSIEDTTLTALGDAVRKQTSEIKTGYRDSIDAFDLSLEVGYTHNYYFPAGTRSALIKRPSKNLVVSYYLKNDTTGSNKFINFAFATEEITVTGITDGSYFQISNMKSTIHTASYEITSYDADGNIIQAETEVKNTMTPIQMAAEINALTTMPAEAFTFTGDCEYKFTSTGWNWFIEKYGDKITTKDITDCNHLFYFNNGITSIPFEFNITNDCRDFSYMFYGGEKLQSAPLINGSIPVPNKNSVITFSNAFIDCYRLKSLPHDYFTRFLEDADAYCEAKKNLKANGSNNVFGDCRALRKLPDLRPLVCYSTSIYSSLYYYAFDGCYSLDEIVDLPVEPGAYTSNAFGGTFKQLYLLKRLTFETNADGSPITAAWSKQTIDLTAYIGYAQAVNSIQAYNDDLSSDMAMNDDATYQALKDNPNSFAAKIDYATYNHDSAVETINSLPDVSAGSGNIIKFKGAAGALTDGGAINTLTEEEIAVATAKGWTVTIS